MKKKILKWFKGTILEEAKKTLKISAELAEYDPQKNGIVAVFHVEIFGEILIHKRITL